MVAALSLFPMGARADAPLLERVETFLTSVAADLEPVPPGPVGRGRPRLLPALALWGGLTVCVLRGWHEQKALWRRLTGTGLWHFTPRDISDEAVYQRLATATPSPMADFFATVTAVLTERLTPYADTTLAPFAAEVFALDQTALDPVARRLPAFCPPGAASRPAMTGCSPASWPASSTSAVSSGGPASTLPIPTNTRRPVAARWSPPCRATACCSSTSATSPSHGSTR